MQTFSRAAPKLAVTCCTIYFAAEPTHAKLHDSSFHCSHTIAPSHSPNAQAAVGCLCEWHRDGVERRRASGTVPKTTMGCGRTQARTGEHGCFRNYEYVMRYALLPLHHVPILCLQAYSQQLMRLSRGVIIWCDAVAQPTPHTLCTSLAVARPYHIHPRLRPCPRCDETQRSLQSLEVHVWRSLRHVDAVAQAQPRPSPCCTSCAMLT